MDLKSNLEMIKSYCKVNLFLKVLRKNNKGLHSIQSTVMLLDLHDEMSIKKIKKNKDEVVFIGRFKKNIKSKILNTNVVKGEAILKKYIKLIEKKIFRSCIE